MLYKADMAKSAIVMLRMEPTDKKKIEKAAKRDHLALATWIRMVAIKEAERPAK